MVVDEQTREHFTTSVSVVPFTLDKIQPVINAPTKTSQRRQTR
jgi:hypothetical protein